MRAFPRGFMALAILICGLGQAQASIIFNTMPDNPASTPETLLGRSIMNVITVGGSDVDITGFGTFGRLEAAGNLQWVIFANSLGSSPLFSTGPVAASAGVSNMWYDSPAFAFTLKANTTYQMGLMADQLFTYNWDFPGVTVSQGGLTQGSGDNGNAQDFANPVLTGGGVVVNSLRIVGVPEPSSIASFLIGTCVAGSAAWRRRRRTA